MALLSGVFQISQGDGLRIGDVAQRIALPFGFIPRFTPRRYQRRMEESGTTPFSTRRSFR